MSHLEGVKAIKLKKDDYKQIADFIAKLNENRQGMINAVKAKECLDSPIELIENLQK